MPVTTCNLCKIEFDLAENGNVFYKANSTNTDAVAISLCHICYEGLKKIVAEAESRIRGQGLNGNDVSHE